MTEHPRGDSSRVCAGGWEQPAGVEERCSASTVYREAALRPRVCLVRGSQFGGRESPSWDLEVQCVGLEGFAVRTGGLAAAGPFLAPADAPREEQWRAGWPLCVHRRLWSLVDQ